MLQKIGLALLAVMTLGISVLIISNKSLKSENKKLAEERDLANHEAKVARVEADMANRRLKEQEQINDKFDSVEIDPNDIKVGLDE